MKKLLFAVVILIILAVGSGCGSVDTSYNANALRGAIGAGDIAYIRIHGCFDGLGEITFTKESDFSFLDEYIYQGEYSGELHALFLFPFTKRAYVYLANGERRQFYILNTGEIVFREMLDAGVLGQLTVFSSGEYPETIWNLIDRCTCEGWK
ncbi:MAG: hypothetical protein FWB88_01695 [Defluviitaleaceae bacterium]|nr:hypothetical protein [Defluviitaleaceae bacterium]MCL2239435.1 hypothetical protein [Defluviitaleaceae bacterium]